MLRAIVSNGRKAHVRRFLPRFSFTKRYTSDIVIDEEEENKINFIAEQLEKHRSKQHEHDFQERVQHHDIKEQLFSIKKIPEIKSSNKFFYADKKIPSPLYGIEPPSKETFIQANQFFPTSKPKLEFSCGSSEEYPPTNPKMPEIAFIGRSNAGKSSLLNAICKTDVASVSSTPGHTKRIHFYNLSNMMYMVDMPGYGYAETNKEEKAKWLKSLETFITSRNTLLRVFVLMDALVGVKDIDFKFLSFLSSSCMSHQIVLTKCDKLHHDELVACMKNVYKQLQKDDKLNNCYPYIIPTSAVTNDGIDELRANILIASGIDDRKALLPEHRRASIRAKEEVLLQQVSKIAAKYKHELAPEKRSKDIKREEYATKNIKKPTIPASKTVLGLD